MTTPPDLLDLSGVCHLWRTRTGEIVYPHTVLGWLKNGRLARDGGRRVFLAAAKVGWYWRVRPDDAAEFADAVAGPKAKGVARG